MPSGKGFRGKLVTEELWKSLLGYTWVVSWLTFSDWWFVKLYTSIGVLKWQLPF